MYFHMNCDYKSIMKSQKNGHGNTQIAKDFFIYKRSPLKMQKILKHTNTSR